jgi:hypothetical protein
MAMVCVAVRPRLQASTGSGAGAAAPTNAEYRFYTEFQSHEVRCCVWCVRVYLFVYVCACAGAPRLVVSGGGG